MTILADLNTITVAFANGINSALMTILADLNTITVTQGSKKSIIFNL